MVHDHSLPPRDRMDFDDDENIKPPSKKTEPIPEPFAKKITAERNDTQQIVATTRTSQQLFPFVTEMNQGENTRVHKPR